MRYRESPPPATNPDEFRAVVEGRRSVRQFEPGEVPQEVLDYCLDMALLAPNSSNLQPWEFVVVRQPPHLAELAEACLNQNAAKTAPLMIVQLAHTNNWRQHANQLLAEWPQDKIPSVVNKYYKQLVPLHFTTGPLDTLGLVKAVSQRVVSQFRPLPRFHESQADLRVWAAKSCALACENLMLAARAQGYDSCPMEGFDEARVKKLVRAADDTFVVMVIALGKRTAEGVYYPRQRFAKNQMVREL